MFNGKDGINCRLLLACTDLSNQERKMLLRNMMMLRMMKAFATNSTGESEYENFSHNIYQYCVAT